jgi:hypothetical protein
MAQGGTPPDHCLAAGRVHANPTRGKTRRQEDQEDIGHDATLINFAPDTEPLREPVRIDNRVDKEEEVDEARQPTTTHRRTATGEETHRGLLSRVKVCH